MATVMISNPHGSIDKARLAAFECRIGIELPGEFREFLILHNGAILSPSLFALPGTATPYACLNDQTFGLHDGEVPQLDRVYENCLDYLPPSLVAFAEDSGGDLFCIGTQGEQRGKVYCWNHHHPYCGDDEPSFENVELIFLSESFTEFINQLTADE